MLDFNSRSRLSDRLNYLIDAPIIDTASESQDRRYLGASVVGHYCERHVQFHLLAARGQVTRPQPEARILRIFDRGNTYEAKVRRWLKDAGFLFGSTINGLDFSDFDGQFRGHVDGVITGWRKILDDNGITCPVQLPALWENKCLGAKGWKKLSEDRLKEYSSTYYVQVQLYMHYVKLQRCLFTAINADTMQLYHEIVGYDATEANLAVARVSTVIQASDNGQLVPRCTSDQNYYICKWCDYRGECWK